MAYPNLKNDDHTFLKLTTKNDKVKELKNKSKKHDHENV